MKDEYIAGQLVATHLLIAYLLARDSAQSGTDVRLMQEPMIQELSDVIAKLGAPASLPTDSFAAVEASATRCLDRVFQVAAGLRSHMPGPNDFVDD